MILAGSPPNNREQTGLIVTQKIGAIPPILGMVHFSVGTTMVTKTNSIHMEVTRAAVVIISITSINSSSSI
jgi:hypothetical protein